MPEDRLPYFCMLRCMLNILARCASLSCPKSCDLFGVVLSQWGGISGIEVPPRGGVGEVMEGRGTTCDCTLSVLFHI